MPSLVISPKRWAPYHVDIMVIILFILRWQIIGNHRQRSRIMAMRCHPEEAWRTKPSSHFTLLGVVVPGSSGSARAATGHELRQGAAIRAHVGDKVFGKRRSNGQHYFKGTITAMEGDNECVAILFDDGDFDPTVPARYVKGVPRARGGHRSFWRSSIACSSCPASQERRKEGGTQCACHACCRH